MKKYQDINKETINRWIDEGWEWGIPISSEAFQSAKAGVWGIYLTPTKTAPINWFPRLKNAKVLGLASGGGQQMPILTALGAICTVLDYSDKQLESEQLVADREGYEIKLIQGDMTEKLPFADETFDLIVHPVSNVYIKDAKPVFKECYRVLKKGGILLSGLDNAVNFLVDEHEEKIIHKFPFDPTINKDQYTFLQNEDAGLQFSHTLEEQIGGQLEAGFIITDLYEDTNGTGRLHDLNIPTFFATRSIK